MSGRLSEADVGKFFLDSDDGTVWTLVSYCASPTAEFERLEKAPTPPGYRPLRKGGAVGSPLLAPLRRLVPETD